MLSETDTLSELLNHKEFLSRVVQALQSEWVELDDHLQQARWSQAKNKAHQLKGVFYLLEAGSLLDSLHHIEDKNLPLISESEFRLQLQQQIELICMKIKRIISL